MTQGRRDRGLPISAVAEATGVTADTIRYYERVGLLPPPPRASAGALHAGYRRYAAADVERLAFIRRARDLGFSLDEIRYRYPSERLPVGLRDAVQRVGPELRRVVVTALVVDLVQGDVLHPALVRPAMPVLFATDVVRFPV